MRISIGNVYKAGVVTVAAVESAFVFLGAKTGMLEKFAREFLKDDALAEGIHKVGKWSIRKAVVQITGESVLWPLSVGSTVAWSKKCKEAVKREIKNNTENDQV